jgi:hypothetical protein
MRGTFRGKMTDYRLAYKQRHRATGLCVACPEKATHGDRCRDHWMKQKIVKRRYRAGLSQRRTDAGLCIDCASPLDPDSDGPRVCVNCGAHKRLKPERKGNLR